MQPIVSRLRAISTSSSAIWPASGHGRGCGKVVPALIRLVVLISKDVEAAVSQRPREYLADGLNALARFPPHHVEIYRWHHLSGDSTLKL
jgi:hypothetical protein